MTAPETVLLDLRRHPKALVRPVVVLLGTVAAAGFVAARFTGGGPRLGVTAAAAAVLLTWALAPYLRWRSSRFVLTDARVSLRSGVLRRTGRDVPLWRVEEVRVTRTLRQRLQGCGTLHVLAGDVEPLVVPDLAEVEAAQRAVTGAVDALDRVRGG